jgi:hypothetical protein
MTRAATLENEDALLNTAYHGSAQQLELEAISVILVRPAANDFSSRWWKRDADVLDVLQGVFAPSGRKIIGSPEGYGPFSRLLRCKKWGRSTFSLTTDCLPVRGQENVLRPHFFPIACR